MSENEESCFKELKEYGNIELSLEYVIKVIGEQNIGNNIVLLDIGTNIGSLPYRLYESGIKDVHGTDIRSEAIEYGKKRYKEIDGKLKVMRKGVLPYSDNTFDYVTAFDVIEHVPNVDELLMEIYRVLKPDGKFIFQTPNLYINSIWETIRWKSFTEWKKEHCSLQTCKSLKRKLDNAGLNNIIIEKNNLYSEFNEQKLKKYIGALNKIVLKMLNKLPITVFPNIWGNAKK
ncbi:class I SAM-dependent methyltransferase [Clostridium saccharoperbutylacetonicum]